LAQVHGEGRLGQGGPREQETGYQREQRQRSSHIQHPALGGGGRTRRRRWAGYPILRPRQAFRGRALYNATCDEGPLTLRQDARMWKVLHQSVPGTSHRRSGLPCQDTGLALENLTPRETVWVRAGAAGAGGARHGEGGARPACQPVPRLVCDALDAGLEVSAIDQAAVLSWYAAVCRFLDEHART